MVAGSYAEELGVEEETLLKAASFLGGGMFSSGRCGAVTGAYLAIGLKYGHSQFGEQEKKQKVIEKIHEFNEKFLETYDSLECPKLLGYDLQVKEEREKIEEENIILNICPGLVQKSMEILDEIL